MNANGFTHIQRFAWVWFIFGYAIAGMMIWGAVAGNAEQKGTLWAGIFVALLTFLGRITRLEITIDSDGISYQWKPFQKKPVVFKKPDINFLTITRYPFLGYGYRVSAKYGTVQNTRGGIGLWLKTKNKESYLLGISDVKGVREALKKYGYEVASSDH